MNNYVKDKDLIICMCRLTVGVADTYADTVHDGLQTSCLYRCLAMFVNNLIRINLSEPVASRSHK